jgi:hypothetical protein
MASQKISVVTGGGGVSRVASHRPEDGLALDLEGLQFSGLAIIPVHHWGLVLAADDYFP